MDWHIVGPFLMATCALSIVPGPVMALIAHNTLRGGSSGGISTAAGAGLGRLLMLTGVFAALTISGEFTPQLFRWLSLAGAAYLIWLAVNALKLRSSARRLTIPAAASSMSLLGGVMVSVSNPATLAFFAVFFSQFIDTPQPVVEQMLLLGALYLGVNLAFDLVFVTTLVHIRETAGFGLIVGMAELGSAMVYFAIALTAIVGVLR